MIYQGKIGMHNELFNAYAKEVRQYKILTPEEEAECFERYKSGDESAATEILMSNQRFVLKVARTYGNDDNIMDLISQANLGVMEAIKRYDTESNYKFISYAVWWIRREIFNYFTTIDQPIRKSNYGKMAAKVTHIKNEFYQTNQRYPSIDELKDKLKEYNLDVKDDSDLYDVVYHSIDSKVYDGNDAQDFEETEEFSTRTASYNAALDGEEKEYTKLLVKNLMGILKERERKIIEMVNGIGYERQFTLDEIAEEMGLTRERVRQLKNESEKKMKKAYATVIANVG